MPERGPSESRRPQSRPAAGGSGRPSPPPPAPRRPPIPPPVAASPSPSSAPESIAIAAAESRRSAAGPAAVTWLVPAAVAGGVGLVALAAAVVLVASPAAREGLASLLSPARGIRQAAPAKPNPPQPERAATVAPSLASVVRHRSAEASATAAANAEKASDAADAAAALLVDVAERVQALESSAEQVAKDCAERRSPTSAVERARRQAGELQPLFGEVAARCRTARDAMAAAAAARDVAEGRQVEARGCLVEVERGLAVAASATPRDDRAVAELEAERNATAEVVAAVRLDAEKSTEAAATAATAGAAADAAAVRADELQRRVEGARSRLELVERRLAAAKAAFTELKTRLADRSHRPDEGIDGGLAAPQTRVLCAVGDAVVEPRLPEETPPGGGFSLRCVAAPSGESWEIVAVPKGDGAAVPLGTATISPDRKFTVSVVARDDRNAVARDALATAVVRFDNPLDPAGTTYVQLCRPVAAGPLVLEKFFAGRQRDKSREYPYFADGYACDAVIPATPWVTRLGITGRSGGVVGEIAAGARPDAAPGKARDGGGPLTLAWSWQGEPFLETDVVFETAATSGVVVRLGAARLLPPWDSPQRLGFLWETVRSDARRASFGGLPTAEELDAQTRKVAAATIQTMAARVVADLRRQVPTLPEKTAATLVASIKGGEDRMPLEAWAGRLREALRASPGFDRWMESHDDTRRSGFSSSVRRQPTQAEVQEQLDAYSADLLRRREVTENECREALHCRLIADLEAAREGKLQARQVVEAIGDGSAMLVGDLVATFPSAGGRCVLASFAEGRPAVRRRRPQADRPDAMTSGPVPSTVAAH